MPYFRRVMYDDFIFLGIIVPLIISVNAVVFRYDRRDVNDKFMSTLAYSHFTSNNKCITSAAVYIFMEVNLLMLSSGVNRLHMSACIFFKYFYFVNAILHSDMLITIFHPKLFSVIITVVHLSQLQNIFNLKEKEKKKCNE